jgi:hypothetical protein
MRKFDKTPQAAKVSEVAIGHCICTRLRNGPRTLQKQPYCSKDGTPAR